MKSRLILPSLLLLFIFLISACGKHQDTTNEPEISIPASTNIYPVFDAGLNAYTLTFAGYKWTVRNTIGTQGPGPNYWSKDNVFVDSKGYMHFKLTKDAATNTWKCSEVASVQKLGYGTYQWKLDGRVDTLDHNLVFGMFNYSGNDLHDEMDIEFSRWGYKTNKINLGYTIWPAGDVTTPKNVYYEQKVALTDNYSTHRFTRTPTSISLKSLYGLRDDDTGIFMQKTWASSQASISTLAMPVYINLWCFNAVAPANGKDVEIIVQDFTYTPL